MEMNYQEFKHCTLIAVKGRVDSATAPDFSKGLDQMMDKGIYKIVVDIHAII